MTSPWTPGLGKALRPHRGQALLLVRIQEPFEQSSGEAVPRIRDQLDRQIRAPVVAHMTGFPDIANAIHDGTVKAIEKAELIAVPLLIIILLLVFRSPVAAGVPLALGLTTVGAAGGVLDLINRFAVLDVVSFNLASLMGWRSASTTRCCSCPGSARSWPPVRRSDSRPRRRPTRPDTRSGSPAWRSASRCWPHC